MGSGLRRHRPSNDGSVAMMGQRSGSSRAALLLIQSRGPRSRRSPPAPDRSGSRSRRSASASSAVLQPYRPSLGRPRAYDPHADHRLLLWHSIRAAALRRGAPEPCVSLVLPAGSGKRYAGHSTFSKNRHGRFRVSGTFRWLFDEVVRACMAAGLVKGEGFAVDASVVSGRREPPAAPRARTAWSGGIDRTAVARCMNT